MKSTSFVLFSFLAASAGAEQAHHLYRLIDAEQDSVPRYPPNVQFGLPKGQ